MPMHLRSLPAIWFEVAPARSSDDWTVRAQLGSHFGRRTLRIQEIRDLCNSVQPGDCRFRQRADLCNERIH